LINLLKALFESAITLWVAEFAAMIKDRIGKILPEIFVDFLPRIFVSRFAQLLTKNVVGLVPSGETHYGQPRWQIAIRS
jgi:hypothetical protein